MKITQGVRVLITGGASGLGKIMGRLVLAKGAKLILWDIDRLKLDETIAEFKHLGQVEGFLVDVSDLAQINNAAMQVKQSFGKVDVLINNAGIVVGKFFHEHSPDDIAKTMSVNSNALMYVTLSFLSEMLLDNSGHICNISSSAGLISNPKMSVYAASKWAATGWSDSLRLEMQMLKYKVRVTTVTPYYINTGMFDGVRSLVPILNPEKVAKKIIRGIERDKIYVSMPWSMHFVRFGQGVMPIWLFDWLIGGVLGIYSTMAHFKGHNKNL
ncbi:MAG TPA: short-chain dehydrogenase [Bacteroidales bacterium]|nr:short-chain dehydrogenase [Bacteroidales bacterium]